MSVDRGSLDGGSGDVAIGAQSPAGIAPLPLARTVVAAYVATGRDAGLLLRLGLVPLLVTGLLSATLHWYLWPLEIHSLRHGGSGSKTIVVFSTLIGTLAMTTMMVAWLPRLVHDEPRARRPGTRIDHHVQRCFAAAVLLIALWLTPALSGLVVIDNLVAQMRRPTGTQLMVIAALSIVTAVGLVIAARLSLMLPAIGLDDSEGTLGEMWRRTRGSHARIVAGAAAALAPAISARMMIGAALGERPGRLEFTLVATAEDVVGLALSMVWIAFLALAWRHYFPAPRRP